MNFEGKMQTPLNINATAVPGCSSQHTITDPECREDNEGLCEIPSKAILNSSRNMTTVSGCSSQHSISDLECKEGLPGIPTKVITNRSSDMTAVSGRSSQNSITDFEFRVDNEVLPGIPIRVITNNSSNMTAVSGCSSQNSNTNLECRGAKEGFTEIPTKIIINSSSNMTAVSGCSSQHSITDVECRIDNEGSPETPSKPGCIILPQKLVESRAKASGARHMPESSIYNAKAVNLSQHYAQAVDLTKHNAEAVNLRKHNAEAVNLSKHNTNAVHMSKHNAQAVDLIKYNVEAVNLNKHSNKAVNVIQHNAEAVNPSRLVAIQPEASQTNIRAKNVQNQLSTDGSVTESLASPILFRLLNRKDSLSKSATEQASSSQPPKSASVCTSKTDDLTKPFFSYVDKYFKPCDPQGDNTIVKCAICQEDINRKGDDHKVDSSYNLKPLKKHYKQRHPGLALEVSKLLLQWERYDKKRRRQQATDDYAKSFVEYPKILAESKLPTYQEVARSYSRIQKSYGHSVAEKRLSNEVMRKWKECVPDLPHQTDSIQLRESIRNNPRLHYLSSHPEEEDNQLFDISLCECSLPRISCRSAGCTQDDCLEEHLDCTCPTATKVPAQHRQLIKQGRESGLQVPSHHQQQPSSQQVNESGVQSSPYLREKRRRRPPDRFVDRIETPRQSKPQKKPPPKPKVVKKRPLRKPPELEMMLLCMEMHSHTTLELDSMICNYCERRFYASKLTIAVVKDHYKTEHPKLCSKLAQIFDDSFWSKDSYNGWIEPNREHYGGLPAKFPTIGLPTCGDVARYFYHIAGYYLLTQQGFDQCLHQLSEDLTGQWKRLADGIPLLAMSDVYKRLKSFVTIVKDFNEKSILEVLRWTMLDREGRLFDISQCNCSLPVVTERLPVPQVGKVKLRYLGCECAPEARVPANLRTFLKYQKSRKSIIQRREDWVAKDRSQSSLNSGEQTSRKRGRPRSNFYQAKKPKEKTKRKTSKYQTETSFVAVNTETEVKDDFDSNAADPIEERNDSPALVIDFKHGSDEIETKDELPNMFDSIGDGNIMTEIENILQNGRQEMNQPASIHNHIDKGDNVSSDIEIKEEDQNNAELIENQKENDSKILDNDIKDELDFDIDSKIEIKENLPTNTDSSDDIEADLQRILQEPKVDQSANLHNDLNNVTNNVNPTFVMKEKDIDVCTKKTVEESKINFETSDQIRDKDYLDKDSEQDINAGDQDLFECKDNVVGDTNITADQDSSFGDGDMLDDDEEFDSNDEDNVLGDPCNRNEHENYNSLANEYIFGQRDDDDGDIGDLDSLDRDNTFGDCDDAGDDNVDFDSILEVCEVADGAEDVAPQVLSPECFSLEKFKTAVKMQKETHDENL